MAVFILEKKIESAKLFLRFSDYSYADIAAILAFSSQSHFIHVFKQYAGMTPGQYRRSNLGTEAGHTDEEI